MTVKSFPTLYQKTNTGAIQSWAISVVNDYGYDDSQGVIYTVFGQVNGKLQTTTDTINEGKNAGKKNATTAVQQAINEAEAKWTKQLKKGYVLTIEAAQNDEVDALVEGGIEPMLAHSYSKQADKIVYPAMCQFKLDGIRVIAILKNGVCTLWSRTRRPVTGIPHIARAIEDQFKGQDLDLILDGEAYLHAYKDDFEKIVSLVRQDVPKPGHEIVQYWIYDLPSCKGPFAQRTLDLGALFENLKHPETLVLVDTQLVRSEDELMENFNTFTSQGFEGVMVRNLAGKYEEGKRSVHLQKVKTFLDAEWPIVGVEEGRGKLVGHAGAFVCQMADGRTFKAKLMGETSRLKEFFENPAFWQGEMATVKYQNLTSDGIPRFPVAVRIRKPE